MKPMLSIIYAHRNRDTERIKLSFESLRKQQLQNFEVIFVDYGSEDALVLQLQDQAAQFDFLNFHSLKVPQLLWNKSKALNYGIKKASGDYVFIADIDLIFHPDTTQLLQQVEAPDKFQLFKLGYLNSNESQKLKSEYKFQDLKPDRFGEVNGMILTSRESLLKVNGLDEFFHFYGAEDEDLFARLENAGLIREKRDKSYFYHNWHKSFSGSEDKLLTGNPRVKNIMRINQQHFFRNRDLEIIKPLRQNGMGKVINEEQRIKLNISTKTYKIPNIAAQVEHFLYEELQGSKNEIVHAEFYIDSFYNSIKYKLKVKMGKQTQTYYTIKQVNDLVLKRILFEYRDHNYSFKISEDLSRIFFYLEVSSEK